jgi:proliferating cell nuclear antigen
VIDLSPGEADSLFSLDYLKDIQKSIDGDDELTIRLGEEFPMKMETQFANGDGDVLFMLAPRIDSE